MSTKLNCFKNGEMLQMFVKEDFLKTNKPPPLMLCCVISKLIITTKQFHSSKSELKFCTGSNAAHGISEFAMVRVSDNSPGWK